MERLSDERVREHANWLFVLAERGGKGVVDNIDARGLRRIAVLLDELLELRAKLAAYKLLDAAQCAQLASYSKEDRRDHAARSTLESEREANRLLTEENDRLRAEAISLNGALKMAAAERDNFAAALAAGPVMPEVPQSELVFDELSRVMSWERAIEMYADVRAALLEQSR